MHSLLALSSVLLVMIGGGLALAFLRQVHAWERRRAVQLAVLAAPILSLGIGVASLHHFSGRVCFLGSPPWDYVVGTAFPLAIGVVALAGVTLGLARVVVMARVVGRRGAQRQVALEPVAQRLAERLGGPGPRVLVSPLNRPLAFAFGLRRPTVLLSTWMLDHLDRHELEAVLAHELSHIARGDYLVVWLATVLRDAFFYLPTSWVAYRQLQHEKELACDDLAVQLTRRPLALAAALAKVWQPTATVPAFAPVQPLVGRNVLVERRIRRLLGSEPPPAPSPDILGFAPHRFALGAGALGVAGLVGLEALTLALLLAPMGCGPASNLAKLVV